LFINDRIDIAMAIGADGIHLPESSWPATLARRVFPNFTYGVSVHSLEGAFMKSEMQVDFIVFGPVFDTPSKQAMGMTATGIEALRDVCSAVTIPIIAIGGMTPKRAALCRNAGAHGVAVMSDLLMASSLTERMAAYREELGSL
jgi:thiamine-phosphate pyrophosphorylase